VLWGRGARADPRPRPTGMALSSCPSINQKSPQNHTRGQRRSHIPAPPQGAANPASWSDAGLGGCERIATALVCETRSFKHAFYFGGVLVFLFLSRPLQMNVL